MEKMEIDKDSLKLTLSNDLIKPALILSMEAHKQHHQHYITNTKKHGFGSSSMDVSIFAFPGSWEVNDWYDDDGFGEADIDQILYPSLRRIGEDKLAKVNKAFLQRFRDLLNNSEFKSEVEKVVKEDKKILFTGHSSGGAIASLATLWMLDECRLKFKIPIGCVTFGLPLIGDGTLTHAVRREKWSGHFTHFVLEHDIFPRMMLSPKTSIQQHLPNILKSVQQKVKPATTPKSKFAKFLPKKTPERATDNDQMVKPEEAVAFFENVLINASTVASHDAVDLMEPTSTLKEKLSVDFVKVSPYRPFGDYIFCTQDETGPRQQLVVENPNAVLQLLFYFLQLPNEDQNLAEFAVNSLAESLSYEEELNKNGWQFDNKFYLQNLNKHLLTSNGTTDEAVRTSNKALFDLTASAKWCLLAVEESEKRKKENNDQIKKSMRKYKSDKPPGPKIIEDILEKIQEYKKKYDDGKTDYYEAFKLQEKEDDFEANMNRLEQAKIWDVVVEMVMRKDLPDEFEVWDELVDLATKFRYLVEPLDIANYYRHSKGDGYMAVRPKRYKFSQRWYEHANVMKFEPISESNFVAEVEELMKEVEVPKNKTLEKIKEELEILKNKVQNWRSDNNTQKDDVFWGESILSRLQEKLNPEVGASR